MKNWSKLDFFWIIVEVILLSGALTGMLKAIPWMLNDDIEHPWYVIFGIIFSYIGGLFLYLWIAENKFGK